MMFPLVSDLAAEGVPVRLTCGVLGFSPQAFYKWKRRPCSDRDWADAHTTNVIVDVHSDDPEFGYRFIADELEALGERSCERRVWRLCNQHRVWSTTTKKGRKHSGKTPGPAVHDDLVQRVFSAPAPDVVWLTDITEHATVEGKLYCCAIKDVFSNRIVGWSIDSRTKSRLAFAAIEMAVVRRDEVAGCIVHSDRGSQFSARKVQRALTAIGWSAP
jgi:transposase InsO family protein